MTSVSTTTLDISFDSLTFVVRLHVRTVEFCTAMCALCLPALSLLSGVGRSGRRFFTSMVLMLAFLFRMQAS